SAGKLYPSLITGRHASLSGWNEYAVASGELTEAVRRQEGMQYSPRLGPGLAVDDRRNLVDLIKGVWDTRGLMQANEDLELAEEIARGDIPEGASPSALYMTRLIENFEASGIKVPPKLAAPIFMVFPNLTTPGSGRSLWVFRFRPYGNDPDWCYY